MFTKTCTCVSCVNFLFQNKKKEKDAESLDGKEMRRTRLSSQGCPQCFPAICQKPRKKHICVSFYDALLCTVELAGCVGGLECVAEQLECRMDWWTCSIFWTKKKEVARILWMPGTLIGVLTHIEGLWFPPQFFLCLFSISYTPA